jgi:hypothetical protein
MLIKIKMSRSKATNVSVSVNKPSWQKFLVY